MKSCIKCIQIITLFLLNPSFAYGAENGNPRNDLAFYFGILTGYKTKFNYPDIRPYFTNHMIYYTYEDHNSYAYGLTAGFKWLNNDINFQRRLMFFLGLERQFHFDPAKDTLAYTDDASQATIIYSVNWGHTCLQKNEWSIQPYMGTSLVQTKWRINTVTYAVVPLKNEGKFNNFGLQLGLQLKYKINNNFSTYYFLEYLRYYERFYRDSWEKYLGFHKNYKLSMISFNCVIAFNLSTRDPL